MKTFSRSTGYKKIRREALRHFDGSYGLFLACWRSYCCWVNQGGVDDGCTDEWLEAEATRLVNDPSSDRYIMG